MKIRVRSLTDGGRMGLDMTGTKQKFDYIVVGAGSAGCVLANRLSARDGTRVLLLEAGPSDGSVILRMPAAMGLPLETTRFNWKYFTEPDAGLDNRVSEQHRGGDGPLYVQRCRAENPLYHAFLRAGEQYGLAMTPDHNGRKQEGVHIAQVTIKNGVRQSTAEAFLKPVRNRSNLKIATNSLALKLISSGNRITGISYSQGGIQHDAEAEIEVILAAGALGSPHILMRSGIGDTDDLRQHGIKMVQHLPGVGKDMQDHIGVPIQYTTNKSVSPTKQLSPVGRLFTGAKWMLTKGGLGASNFFEVGAFYKSDDNLDGPNLQHEFFPMVGMYHQGKAQAWDGFQYFTSIMHPKSRGQIRLKSANPTDYPELRFNYFSDPSDLRTLAIAVQKTREMVRQSSWNELRKTELSPGYDVGDINQLEAWIRSQAGSGYHPVATCRMGDDQMAVTDQAGKVHGTEGLRIVDASIIPLLPTGNTNAATIMLAEKLSDAILGQSLPAKPVDYA